MARSFGVSFVVAVVLVALFAQAAQGGVRNCSGWMGVRRRRGLWAGALPPWGEICVRGTVDCDCGCWAGGWCRRLWWCDLQVLSWMRCTLEMAVVCGCTISSPPVSIDFPAIYCADAWGRWVGGRGEVKDLHVVHRGMVYKSSLWCRV